MHMMYDLAGGMALILVPSALVACFGMFRRISLLEAQMALYGASTGDYGLCPKVDNCRCQYDRECG